MARAIAIVVLAACGSGTKTPPAEPTGQVDPAARATVRLEVEGNRPFVTVTFLAGDGRARDARFLVDSGGGAFLIVEPLAKELGLEVGETSAEGDFTFARVTSRVAAAVGTVALELEPARTLVAVGKTSMLPPGVPGHADGMLPGHVLAKYHVVFDYPRGELTIAKPGALASEGTPLPMPVSEATGFPRTELVIDGETYGFLLDTGAAFTMVSQARVEAWGAAHPQWERHQGAFGDAALLGGQTLETMFIPEASWGGRSLRDVGVTSQQTGVFEDWMSSMMTAPIVGSLAGNVLKTFRVDLDYPNQQLYLSGS